MLKLLFPLSLVLFTSPLFGQVGTTTSALPNPIVGKAVSGTVWALSASGGTTPYSWVVSLGSLPTGLSLSPAGTITGTATSAGAATFTVRVTDSASATATKQFTITAQNAIGRGCTTATVSDWDCDYYGPGSPIGMDADDNDPTVNTPASMLAKYGTLASFLAIIKGYSPLHIWYVSTSGNNTTCAVDNSALPCLTWAGASGKIGQGDAVMFRSGTYSPADSLWVPFGAAHNGTSSHPNIVMAYPGEKPILDHTGSGYYGFYFGDPSYWVFDGLTLQNTPCAGQSACGMGFNLSGTTPVNGITIRNCEIKDYYDGIWAIAGSSGTLIERNVIHDNLGEHNIYVGWNSDDTQHSANMIVRNNILYNANRDNFHDNGICDGCDLSGNIMYSANMAGGGGAANISMQNGWNHGTISNNIVFTASGTVLEISAGDDAQPNITARDGNYNQIANNTFIHTGRSASGEDLSNSGFSVFLIEGSGAKVDLDLGHNTYINNILIEGAASQRGSAMLRYFRHSAGYADWLTTDTWTNNIIYTSNGAQPLQNGVATTYTGLPYYNWSQFAGQAASFTGHSQSDPMLIAWNPAWYAAPGNYNLALQAGSPAVAAGTLTGAPTTDIRGVSRSGSANIGAYESSTVAASRCDLNGDGVVDVLDVKAATQQVLGILPCGTADLDRNGRCDVVDVQRIVIAVLTGICN